MTSLTLNVDSPVRRAVPLEKDTELEKLAEAALSLDVQAKAIADEAKAAKDAFKAALEERGRLNPDFKGIGHVQVVIKQPMAFDEAKALELLTEDEIRQASKLQATLVRQIVAPAAYKLMEKPGTISMTLKAGA